MSVSRAWVVSAVFVIALLANLAMVPSALAGSQTSVVFDPVGDMAAPAGAGHTGQPYQDLTRAEITKRGNTFYFEIDVAAPIPERPPLPPGIDTVYWVWGFGSGETAPAGYPRAPGITTLAEGEVILVWDGKTFSMVLVDRRPLLTGGDAVVTPLPFTIKGSRIDTQADAMLMGDPSTFFWLALTANRAAGFGNEARFQFDVAPNVGFAVWPGE